MEDKYIDDEWEWYIGKLFSFIIQNLNIHPDVVVEFAPGYKYKIAYALKNIQFQGTLYVIDIDKNVLNFINDKYKEILPNSNIITINKNLEDAYEYLPENIDLLLSNHPFDDIMINKYIQLYYQNKNSINDITFLNKSWEELCNNKEILLMIKQYTKQCFMNFYKHLNIKSTIISQYDSNLFFKENTTNMNKVVNEMFLEIKKEFIQNNIDLYNYFPFGIKEKRYNYPELLNNTQNTNNWIIQVEK